jgi:hypothetical protein
VQRVKRCKHCGEEKPLADFYGDTAARDGHRPECKSCTKRRRLSRYQSNREAEIARVRRWQQANAEHVKAYQAEYRERRDFRAEHLRRTFGMTQGDYVQMLDTQDGGCAICGRKPRPGKHLHVDHDHDTGRVRGLLCFSCNVGIGNFDSDSDRMAEAADYVDDNGTRAELVAAARSRVRELVRAGSV